MHQNSRRYIKGFPKFECNIYSDIDLQLAISVSSTGNSRSFTELTDRLAFVNFSSPGLNIFLFPPSLEATYEIMVTTDLKAFKKMFEIVK